MSRLSASDFSPTASRGSADQLGRVIYVAVGVSAIVFGALCFDNFLQQADNGYFGLALLGFLTVFGLPASLAALAPVAPLRTLRFITVVEAVVFVAVLLSWLLLLPHPLPAGADIPWVTTFTAVPCVALAIGFPGWVAWTYSIAVCGLGGVVRAVSSSGETAGLIGVEDALITLLLVAVFVGLTIAIRRNAGEVDAAIHAARTEATLGAERLARNEARLSVDAMVHDSVLSTLLMAGRAQIAPAAVSESAAATLDSLDALRMQKPEPQLRGSDVARRLQQLANELAPAVVFRAEVESESPLPGAAAAALLGAAGEALRNSIADAGGGPAGPAERRVERRVTFEADHELVRIVIADDGVGFDPTNVPTERLGIAHSILGRMRRVPGGGVLVRSSPGAGTEVVLTWHR
ncbi:ATP-binding protein [Glaciibacter superstes]|uniref:ATP-binding protein n=1 Tax=Glaciibacter superstes TaxID=501023 RepID=UPI0003B4D93E|nr:ATP-binding protein [Glaciibacter superstes]